MVTTYQRIIFFLLHITWCKNPGYTSPTHERTHSLHGVPKGYNDIYKRTSYNCKPVILRPRDSVNVRCFMMDIYTLNYFRTSHCHFFKNLSLCAVRISKYPRYLQWCLLMMHHSREDSEIIGKVSVSFRAIQICLHFLPRPGIYRTFFGVGVG